MGLVSLKCPNCGADVEFDSGLDYGHCKYCGSKIMQEKTVVVHQFDESGKYSNYIGIADRAYESENYTEAYEYYTKALEINQEDVLVIFRKAVCSGSLSLPGDRSKEVITGVKTAFSAADESEKKKMSDEIIRFVTSKVIRQPSEFSGASSCECFVFKINGFLTTADAMYEHVRTENAEKVTQYCRSITNACDLISPSYYFKQTSEGKKTNFNVNLSLSGLSLKTNTVPDVPGVYQTPSYVLSNIAAVKKKYLAELNSFTNREIEKNKSIIADAKKEISALPVYLRVLHIAFSVPMLIAAVILALIYPVPGLILLAGEIICYAVYLKKDRDNHARNAYTKLRELYLDNAKKRKEIK